MKITFIGMSPSRLTDVRPHKHEEWEILYFFEGEGTVIIGGEEYGFEPGVILTIPPLVHTEKSLKGFRDIFIRVKGFTMPSLGQVSTVSVFKDTPENDIGHLTNLAYRVYHKKEKNWENTVYGLFNSIYQLLISWTPDKNYNTIIEQFKNMLIQNVTNSEFDISKAMLKSGFSKNYLRKKFKESTGYTPLGYIINLRIEYALKLISQRRGTGYSLKEIAIFSGFADPYYFSRLIKAKTGKSPTEWSQ